jgi:4-hydroxy-4-methyl-2-oxoglutarate aldolase
VNLVPPTCALADVLALTGRPGSMDIHGLNAVSTPEAPVVGRARTVRIEPGRGSFEPLYDLLSERLDGCIVVVEAHGVIGAVWGEILSVAAKQVGALGAVVDGPIRDHAAIVASGLFLWGGRAHTAGPAGLATVTAVDDTVTVAGATVGAGDLIVLDADGVIALPAGDPAFAVAAGYSAAEAQVLADLRAGQALRDAYRHKSAFVHGAMRGSP